MSWEEAPVWLQRSIQGIVLATITGASFVTGDRLDLRDPEPGVVGRMEEVSIRLYRQLNACELRLAELEEALDGHPDRTSQ